MDNMNVFYNKHYVKVDENNNIIEGWSNGPFGNRAITEKDILINDKGGYQFRLFPGGEENPSLFDEFRIPLYKWNGEKVVTRDSEEIKAEHDAIMEKQRINSRIAELKKLLADTDYVVIKIAEGTATQEDYSDIINQRSEWRDEINRLENLK